VDTHPCYPKISPHLLPDEEVLWCQAGPRLRLSVPMLVPVAFFICWTAAALAFTTLATYSRLIDPVDDAFPAPWLGLAFTAIGAGCVWFSWRGLRAGLHTTYAITDRAAIIIEDVWPKRVRRFTADAVSKRAVFGDRIGFMPDPLEGNAFDSTTSFIGVRDMVTAQAALDRIAPAKPRDAFGNLMSELIQPARETATGTS